MITNLDSGRLGKSKIIVVDDHPVVRYGLTWMVSSQPDLEVCAGADGIEQALDQIRKLEPDLAVIDLTLKDGSGIGLLSQIRDTFPKVKTLVWSMFEGAAYVQRSLRAGAMGYVHKQQPMETVISAIREVLKGHIFADRQTTESLLRRVPGQACGHVDPVKALSGRELDIFRMLVRGKSTQEISHRLGIKPSTVATHRDKIKAKLHLNTTMQLNVVAVRWRAENGCAFE